MATVVIPALLRKFTDGKDRVTASGQSRPTGRRPRTPVPRPVAKNRLRRARTGKTFHQGAAASRRKYRLYALEKHILHYLRDGADVWLLRGPKTPKIPKISHRFMSPCPIPTDKDVPAS